MSGAALYHNTVKDGEHERSSLGEGLKALRMCARLLGMASQAVTGGQRSRDAGNSTMMHRISLVCAMAQLTLRHVSIGKLPAPCLLQN